jgi:hypothetical protein
MDAGRPAAGMGGCENGRGCEMAVGGRDAGLPAMGAGGCETGRGCDGDGPAGGCETGRDDDSAAGGCETGRGCDGDAGGCAAAGVACCRAGGGAERGRDAGAVGGSACGEGGVENGLGRDAGGLAIGLEVGSGGTTGTGGRAEGRGGRERGGPSPEGADGRPEDRTALAAALPRALEPRGRYGANEISGSSPRQSFQLSVTIGGRSGRPWKIWSNRAMLTTLPEARLCSASRTSPNRSRMKRSSLSLGSGPLSP